MNEYKINKKGKLVEFTKWDIFKWTIYSYLHRFRIIDTWKYKVIPHSDNKYYFKLSPKEYEDAEKIYKEKGTISYEFYPCGGIGWGTKVHHKDEVIDITDINKW